MSDRAHDKPLLLVGLMHDYAARDFVDSGVLDELARDFRLKFVSSSRLTIDLSRHGPVVARHEIGIWRLRLYWLAAGLLHVAVKRPFELSRRIAFCQATFGVGRHVSRMIDWLARPGIGRALGEALR